MDILIFLLFGAVAGWIAAYVMKGIGYGLIGNMVVGIVGAFVGKFILGFFGFSFPSLPGMLFTAVLCAVILIFIVGLFSRK